MKKYMILSALIVFLITGLSLGQEEDNASSIDDTVIAEDIITTGNDSEIVDEAVSANETIEENETAIEPTTAEAAPEITPSLNYIWAVNGIEDDKITMVLNQEGEDLYGQAKYEPEGAEPWNAVVIGSIMGDKVDLVITALKGNVLVSTKMSGTFADEALSGAFFQVSEGAISGRGEFSAEWINPDTSSYTPAVVEQPKTETPAETTVTAPAATEQAQQPVQLGKSSDYYTDVRKYADQMGPGGDLSGIPPGMSGIL